MSIKSNLERIRETIPEHVVLVAVSKTKPNTDLEEAYAAGQRVFGENKVQELVSKWEALPKDIEWHLLGHLQTNKVKYIVPFVALIHSVDSLKLLQEINKEAAKKNRVVHCLLEVRIAREETKFGLTFQAVEELLSNTTYGAMKNICIDGLMGMASNTKDETIVSAEFSALNAFYTKLQRSGHAFTTLSMGMSGDYPLAIEAGSNMVRVGSAIFGSR
jgi:pyridoxal phosphate enzyme (YggS family)